MRKIGIIHTTPATIASLNQLVEENMADTEIINILDDSMLKDMRDGHHVEEVKTRWIQYARTLEILSADAVLSACSTVGEFAEEADRLLDIPVYRIDEAMAEAAVNAGGSVSVLATLQSTLMPTVRLVEKKAALAGKQVEVHTMLVEGAYDALMQGNQAEHDRLIKEAVSSCLKKSEMILLAQASMASAVTDMKGTEGKILTSPLLGIQKLKRDLAQRGQTI